MNQQSIMDLLRRKDAFTDTEQQAVDYILANTEQVSTMNISDLAKASYTSNGTIIRICRKLGLSGFRDLKYELTKDLEADRYRSTEVDFNTPFGSHQNVPEIIQSMADLYRESVDVTVHVLDYRMIHEAALMLHKANHIVIFAAGDTYITCEAFTNRLIKTGIYCMMANTYGDQHFVADALNKNDCALMVSYSGTTMQDCAKVLAEKSIPMICLTSNPHTYMASHADTLIVIPDKEGETGEKIATFYSQVSFSMVLNILFSLLYAMNN